MPVYPLLGLLWALVLLPPLLRRRVQSRGELAELDRIQLCFAGSAVPATNDREDAPAAPVRRTAAQRRRRVLAVIGFGMVATLAVAVVVGTRIAWGMHLLIYDVLIGYVALLARSRDRAVRRPLVVPVVAPVLRSASVAPLRRPAPAPRPAPALLQAASR